jgi:hypothetical protein
VSVLKKRLRGLEVATGGDRGCGRCRELLVSVSHAKTGEHHSATWNGETIAEGELLESRRRRGARGAARTLSTTRSR